MPRPKITLYIDIVSPFAHIAFHVLRTSPSFAECEITYVPIFLGGLMHKCNNKAPVAITNKDKWIAAERTTWASYFNVPITKTPPPNFPPNTLPIQRTLVSLSISHPHLLTPAIEAFFDNFWREWTNPLDPARLLEIVKGVLGGDEEEARRVLERRGNEEVKRTLTDNTDRAFGEGAFGLPWFTAENARGETQGFWGVDHIGRLCGFLGIEVPEGKGPRALL